MLERFFFTRFSGNAEQKVGLQVLPVFISIDPERDTVEQIREYLKGKPNSDGIKEFTSGPSDDSLMMYIQGVFFASVPGSHIHLNFATYRNLSNSSIIDLCLPSVYS